MSCFFYLENRIVIGALAISIAWQVSDISEGNTACLPSHRAIVEGAGSTSEVSLSNDFRGDPVLFGKRATWDYFGNRWADNFTRALKELTFDRNSPLIKAYAHAVETKDPRLDSLRSLGFKFDPLNPEKIELPEFRDFVSRYEALLQKHIAAGRLKPDETLRPGRAFQDPEGNVHILGTDQEPPPTWVYKNVSDSPVLFTRMISEGFFPISANWRAVHDVSHLAALIDSPAFMARFRRLAGKARPGEMRPKGKDMHVRFFFFFEGLSLVPKEKKAMLLSMLSEPIQNKPNDVVTVSTVGSHLLEKFSKKELEDRAEKLLESVPHLLKSYGNWEIGIAGTNPEITDSIWAIAKELEMVRKKSQTMKGFNPRNLAYSLARLEVALWQSTNVSVEDFYDQVFVPNTPSSSPVYRMFVESGISKGWYPFDPDRSPPTPMYQTLTGTLGDATDLSPSAEQEKLRNTTPPAGRN